MADSPKGTMLEDTISGIKADIEETEPLEPGMAFEADKTSQVPPKESHPELEKLDPLKVDAPLLAEPPTNTHLSPLAARAAVASIVTTANDYVTNGTELDDHPIIKDLSAEFAEETVNQVKELSLDESHGLQKPRLESTEVNEPTARSKRSNNGRKVAELPKSGRVTRSSTQKATSAEKNAGDIRTSGDDEGVVLPSDSKDKVNLTFKESQEDDSLIQNPKSGNSKRSKPKKNTVTQKQEQESSEAEAGKSTPAEEVVKQTPASAVINQPTEGKATGPSRKRKTIELSVPRRLTRSTAQNSSGNADNDVPGKSNDEEVEGRVSQKTRRSTRSSGPKKAENVTGLQDPKKDNFIRKLDRSVEKNISDDESSPAQKKQTVSTDSKRQTPETKKVQEQTSNSTRKAQQTEGGSAKSRWQNKKKSNSKQERRFSPRLLLPRTRSQVKKKS